MRSAKGLNLKMTNKYLGFPWFERKDYNKLLNIFVDSQLMPKTYDEWLTFAKEGIDRLNNDGVNVKIVNIDPATFSDWCKENGLNFDGKARIAFADNYVANNYSGDDG